VTADDWVKIIGAIAGAVVLVVGAIGAVYVQLAKLREQVNGRLTQLLELTERSSEARGRLQGGASSRAAESRWRLEDAGHPDIRD